MSAEEREEVRRLVATGDERAAFGKLRHCVGWPTGKSISATELPLWIAMLGELAARRRAESLAEHVDAVVRDPDSPDQLYALGYALIDAGLPEIAATVLWRCLALVGDSEEVVCELVSALESALAYGDALALLEDHAALRASSFLVRYLYAFNAAMAGAFAITREVLPTLVPDSPESAAMQATIAGMVERADQIAGAGPLDTRDLRGWHYVLTGGLLLHQSPYGFDAPMHGRFAWLADSMARIAFGLDRLAALVSPLGLPCIYAPPGRSHEILARAASLRLSLPIAEWPAVGVPAPGLVIAYNLAEIPAANVLQLVPRRAEQVLFAHASPWTQDGAVSADITTLLYQSLVAPWADDARDAGVIAAELAAAATLSPDELIADETVRWAALVDSAWPPTPGQRSRLWAAGPVPSSRFT